MPAGQAFIDSLADTAILYNDTLPRPFIVMMPLLRRLIAAEQAFRMSALLGEADRLADATVILGTSLGGATTIEEGYRRYRDAYRDVMDLLREHRFPVPFSSHGIPPPLELVGTPA